MCRIIAEQKTTLKTESPLEEIVFKIKRGPIDNKLRQLIINPTCLKFEAGTSKSNSFIVFDKTSIKEYKFGIKWIDGYKFTIGREYQIFIMDNDGQVLKINFKSFYGIRRTEYHHLYAEILNKLWDFYFRDIANDFLTQFWNDQEFTICNVIFSKYGLKLSAAVNLNEHIPWEKVKIRDYKTYFAIYSTEDPSKINKSFNYLADWNTDILNSVTKTILKNIESITS